MLTSKNNTFVSEVLKYFRDRSRDDKITNFGMEGFRFSDVRRRTENFVLYLPVEDM